MRSLETFLPVNSADIDDSAAMQRALDAGPGVLQIGAGSYRMSNVKIPAGVTVQGEGAATVIQPADPAAPVFLQENTGNWTIRDLVIDGEAPAGNWQEREDRGQNGISITRCFGYQIVGVTVQHFRGVGVQISHTPLGENAPFCNGGNLDRLNVRGNFIGLRFDERAEYLNCCNLSAWHNRTGVVIHAGNVKIASSNICSNIDGVFVSDKTNGSHGVIDSTLINHNTRHALYAQNARNGMVISACCFFYGDIDLEDSQGVLISNSEICCNVFTRGKGVNRITGNYYIPHPTIANRMEVTAETILRDNFNA